MSLAAGGGGASVCNGGMILRGSAIALVFVVFVSCGGDEIDCGDGVGLSGDPERVIVADVFATVSGMLFGFRSEFRRLLMLTIDRWM